MAFWGNWRRGMNFWEESPRSRKARARRIRLAVLLLLCACVLFGIWYGTRLPSVTIADIVVSGGETIDLAKVEQAARAALEGSYFLLIPKRFALTYPQDGIAEAVQRLPRVKDAKVERISRTALAVVVVEYFPAGLWCDLPPLNDLANGGGGCVFISQDGFAFAKAPHLAGVVLPRYYTEARPPDVGTPLAATGYIEAVRRFADALQTRHGMRVEDIIETKDGDVRYRIRNGGEFLLARAADIRAVLDNIAVLFSSDAFSHLRSGAFEYIDLRFGNKIFVKESSRPAVFIRPQKTDNAETR